MPKVRPLADKVLIRPKKEEEKTAGGIVLPDSAKEKPQEGTVVAVGPGRLLDNGNRAEMGVKEGDVVIYSKYGGTEISIDGEDYLLMDEGSILAVKE
ncbi:MAG: co-chaperone GroES [Abditibacteriales bacterium]|nr:co-chaperone GroES [Abditibacteriales bacterium]MDW8364554.1 co-chaperone GroES [Abditibacteriales bacterium]